MRLHLLMWVLAILASTTASYTRAESVPAGSIAFLLDCCPPDFRGYRVRRNHPEVLAQFAVHFVNGQHQASQEGLAEVRTSLSEYVEPDVVEAAAQAWLEQGARLARTRRAVALLDEALRGRVFVRKL